MIAFELNGGLAAGQRFMDALQLFTRAVSLGDAESLAQRPAGMTHSTYTPEECLAHGISDGPATQGHSLPGRATTPAGPPCAPCRA
jgi:methionine-gamma-lyase